MAEELKIEKLEEGQGAQPKSGDRVAVHYTGRLTNGKKFDSSLDRGAPFEFRLGMGEVIGGWDRGIATLRVGDRARLTIPPELGYGPLGVPGLIPPNSTLVFEVELVAIR